MQSSDGRSSPRSEDCAYTRGVWKIGHRSVVIDSRYFRSRSNGVLRSLARFFALCIRSDRNPVLVRRYARFLDKIIDCLL